MREITLGGGEMEVQYGINAMMDIERELGYSVFELLNRCTETGRGIGFREIAVVIWAGLRAKHRGIAIDKVVRWLDELDDILSVLEPCMEDLAESLTRRFGVTGGDGGGGKN